MIDISAVYKDGKKIIFGEGASHIKKLDVTYRDRGISFDFNGFS